MVSSIMITYAYIIQLIRKYIGLSVDPSRFLKSREDYLRDLINVVLMSTTEERHGRDLRALQSTGLWTAGLIRGL